MDRLFSIENMDNLPDWVFIDSEEQEYDDPHDDLYLDWYESWDERPYEDWLHDIHGSKLA